MMMCRVAIQDVVVFTNDASRCDHLQEESQNVKDRYYCKVDDNFLLQNNNEPPNNNYIPITEAECNEFTYQVNSQTKTGEWTKVPAHGIAAPECFQAQYTRDNHLGNTLGGQTASYNWTIPDDVSEHCVLRIRYNITSGEYDRDNTTSAQNNRVKRTQGFGPDVWSRFGLTQEEAIARDYQLENDPDVDVFGEQKFKLQVAIDTAQFFRTFQDRSHTFGIRPRPADVPADATIRNLGVRGKRGNIVQTYPGTEYDFVPNTIIASVGDYLHPQWTGSDNNPANNAGQGRARTDRSNIALIKEASYDEGDPKVDTFGQLGSSYPQNLNDVTFAGMSKSDLTLLSTFHPRSGANLAKVFTFDQPTREPDHIGGDMEELDDAGTYFDMGVRPVTVTGTYNYMCTRNNNFSNRSQKGKLIVTAAAYAGQRVDQQGGTISVQTHESTAKTTVMVPSDSLLQATYMELWEEPTEHAASLTESPPPKKDFVSNVVRLEPQERLVAIDDEAMEVKIRLLEKTDDLHTINVYRATDGDPTWYNMQVDHLGEGHVTVRSQYGGQFVVTKTLNSGSVAGIVIGVVALVAIVAAVLFTVRKRKLSVLDAYKAKI